MGASAPSPIVSLPCPLKESSGVLSASCRIPYAYNPRETLSMDGAESHKSSKELPKAVSASFALEDLSVHEGQGRDRGRVFWLRRPLFQ
jgi:hypothetical protein